MGENGVDLYNLVNVTWDDTLLLYYSITMHPMGVLVALLSSMYCNYLVQHKPIDSVQ